MHVPWNDDYFPPSQPLKPMTNVEVLRCFVNASPENKRNLMKATPNVKKLFMLDKFDLYTNEGFIDGFREVTNNLRKLESINWVIYAGTHHDLMYSLDSSVTGFTFEFCKRNSTNFRNKDHLSADELASYQLERKYSSILDLKGKELET